MLWLIQAQLSAARQCDPRESSPRRLFYFRTMNPLCVERRHHRREVVAHQIKLVLIILVTRVTSDFGRWQRENQPAVARIHVMKTKHILEERAIGFRVFAVDDYVCAIDHVTLSVFETNLMQSVLSGDLLCLFDLSVNEETCLTIFSP
jgi:hypothetical protein